MPYAFVFCTRYDAQNDENQRGCRFRDTTNDQVFYGRDRINLARDLWGETFDQIRRRNRERFVCVDHGTPGQLWNRWGSFWSRFYPIWTQIWHHRWDPNSGGYITERRRPPVVTTHAGWLT